MKTLIKIFFLGVVLLTGATVAQALLLTDLFSGGSITAGDKLFDEWSLLNYQTNQPDRSFDAANIDVKPLNDGGLSPGPGLVFDVSNEELSVAAGDDDTFIDLLFGFRVSVLNPMLQIVDSSLRLHGTINYTMDNNYDAGFYIHETLGSSFGLSDLGINKTEFSVLNGAIDTKDIIATTAFEPQDEIWVTQNIRVWATATDTARLTSFDLRFSQTSTPVPEPTTMLLFGAGLAGLAAVGRRRKAQ